MGGVLVLTSRGVGSPALHECTARLKAGEEQRAWKAEPAEVAITAAFLPLKQLRKSPEGPIAHTEPPGSRPLPSS